MTNWISVIIFYSIVVWLIYHNRKKFDFPAKLIALYRTKIGVKLMDRIAKKVPFLVWLFGELGVIVGFFGLIWISYILVKGFFAFFITPDAPAALGLVLPGITTPLWYTLIAIFIVAAIHEFSHGVVARLYNIKVKSSGIVFFGPIIGAFVEPDEKQVDKIPLKKQLAIFAAGPMSNIVLAILIVLLFGLALPGMDFFGYEAGISHNLTQHTAIVDIGSMTQDIVVYSGLEIKEVNEDSPARKVGLSRGEIIKSVNGVDIEENVTGFFDVLSELKPDETLSVGTDVKEYNIVSEASSDNKTKGVIGILFKPIPAFTKKAVDKYGYYGTYALFGIANLLLWLVILNFGIGLANLLPLGPVDGGRMLFGALLGITKNKKLSYKIWKWVSILFLALIVFNIVYPWLRGLFL